MVEWMPEAVLINSSTHQGYDCPRLPLDWGCWFLHYRGRTWSRWASLKSRTVEGLRGQALGSVKHPFIPRGKPVGTKSVHWVMGNEEHGKQSLPSRRLCSDNKLNRLKSKSWHHHMGNSLSLPKPQFLPLQNGDDHGTHPLGDWGFRETMQAKQLT